MSPKRILFSVLVAFLSGILAVSMINFLHRGNLGVFQSLLGVGISIYAVPFLVFTSSYLLEALRTNVILAGGGYGISFKDSVLNNVLGYTFSYLTPFAMGGQPFQIYHLKKLGVDSGYATGVMALRILENTIGASVIALVVLNTDMAWIVKRGQIVFLGISISFSVSFALILSMLRPRTVLPVIKLLSKVFKKEKWIGEFSEWIVRFKKGLDIMWRKKIRLVLFDVAMWFVTLSVQLYSLHYVVNRLVHQHVNFWRIFGIINAVNALAYFMPTPGSSGGIETTYQIVLSNLTGRPDEMLLAVTIWRIVAYYSQIILGLAVFWIVGKELFRD